MVGNGSAFFPYNNQRFGRQVNSVRGNQKPMAAMWKATINFEIATVLAQITGNGETLIAALHHFARL
jgi:DNA modification methylase